MAIKRCPVCGSATRPVTFAITLNTALPTTLARRAVLEKLGKGTQVRKPQLRRRKARKTAQQEE